MAKVKITNFKCLIINSMPIQIVDACSVRLVAFLIE